MDAQRRGEAVGGARDAAGGARVPRGRRAGAGREPRGRRAVAARLAAGGAREGSPGAIKVEFLCAPFGVAMVNPWMS